MRTARTGREGERRSFRGPRRSYTRINTKETDAGDRQEKKTLSVKTRLASRLLLLLRAGKGTAKRTGKGDVAGITITWLDCRARFVLGVLSFSFFFPSSLIPRGKSEKNGEVENLQNLSVSPLPPVVFLFVQFARITFIAPVSSSLSKSVAVVSSVALPSFSEESARLLLLLLPLCLSLSCLRTDSRRASYSLLSVLRISSFPPSAHASHFPRRFCVCVRVLCACYTNAPSPPPPFESAFSLFYWRHTRTLFASPKALRTSLPRPLSLLPPSHYSFVYSLSLSLFLFFPWSTSLIQPTPSPLLSPPPTIVSFLLSLNFLSLHAVLLLDNTCADGSWSTDAKKTSSAPGSVFSESREG